MKIISISGVIGWDVTGQSVRDALASAKGDEIEIQLSSVGGLVFDGLEIFNLIKNYEGKKTARLMGIAASMGSYIPLAADRIIAEGNSVMMIHNAWGIGMGSAAELRAEAAVLEGLSAILADAYVKRTGKTLAEINAMMDAETWLFGNEMLESGFVDEIIGAPEPDKKEASINSARVALADAKRLVSEYEGGDSVKRVAALVDVMKPKTINSGVAVLAERPIKQKGKNMILETLKAENPDVYAQAVALGKADGIKAEKDRMAELAHWKDVNPACASIAEEAERTGKTYAEVASQLSAAAAKGPTAKANDNPPKVASAEPAKPETDEVPGMSAEDVTSLKAAGMTIEQIRANAPKGV